MPVRLYAEIGATLLLLALFAAWSVHERHLGAEKITQADARALSAAHEKMVAQSALEAFKASQADLGADRVQAAVDQYRATHPDGPIRLCSTHNRPSGMPQATAPAGSAQDPGTRSTALPEVPSGSPGLDLSAEFDAILSSAERLAVLYADQQGRLAQ